MRRGHRGARAVITAVLLLAAAPGAAWGEGSGRDTMQLTDTPGNWFRIDYVIEVCERVRAHVSELPGYRIVTEPPALRHFTARFEPIPVPSTSS